MFIMSQGRKVIMKQYHYKSISNFSILTSGDGQTKSVGVRQYVAAISTGYYYNLFTLITVQLSTDRLSLVIRLCNPNTRSPVPRPCIIICYILVYDEYSVAPVLLLVISQLIEQQIHGTRSRCRQWSLIVYKSCLY